MDIFSKEMLYAGGGEQVFVRPNLTANGTVGGNAFAVSGTTSSSSRPLYYAVDNSSSTYWMLYLSSSSAVGYFIFYNPKALKVTELVLNCGSANYIPNTSSLVVQGSNDNSSWTTINKTVSVNSAVVTINLANTTFYNYYRLTLRRLNSTYVYIADLGITATYKG